jgi:SAM-dependent methyltransferase
MFWNKWVSGVSAILNKKALKLEKMQQLPDRKLLREAYLPAFSGMGGRILWVGCRDYTTTYYTVLESQGAEVWTTDIDPALKRWGLADRHRTGDICFADQLFSDMTFDTVIYNGILGYGVDSEPMQKQSIIALSRIIKPGGHLLVGWNTNKIADPVAAGLFEGLFTQGAFAGQPARVSFDGFTHVYDSFTRNS